MGKKEAGQDGINLRAMTYDQLLELAQQEGKLPHGFMAALKGTSPFKGQGELSTGSNGDMTVVHPVRKGSPRRGSE